MLSGERGAGGGDDKTPYVQIAEMKTLASENEVVMSGEKAAYYKVTGSIVHILNNEERQNYYLACQVCKKKVTEEPQGFNCLSCQKYFDGAVPTYNFSMILSDASGTGEYISVLGDQVGDFVLGGTPASDLHEMQQSGNINGIKDLFTKNAFKQVTLLVRARLDTMSQ